MTKGGMSMCEHQYEEYCTRCYVRKWSKRIFKLSIAILGLLYLLGMMGQIQDANRYQSKLITQLEEENKEQAKEIMQLKLAVYEVSKDKSKPAPQPKKKEAKQESISAYEVATNPVSWSITVLGGLEVVRRVITRGL
jgi:hypothetical protein